MSAFGVTIAERAHVAEAEPMSKQKKQIILVGALIAMSALVLAWQYWPSSPEEDPALKATPQIKPVIEAAENKNIPKLQEYVTSNDPIVASRAVTALANLGHDDVINQVQNDQRKELRMAAVGALSSQANKSNLASLARFMENDPSSEVRLQALAGVASVKDFEALDHLMNMLKDPDPTIRNAAYRALEQKSGFRFRGYDPTRPGADNAAMIAKIRNQIMQARPSIQAHFDRQNQKK